jgi:transposase-like protein
LEELESCDFPRSTPDVPERTTGSHFEQTREHSSLWATITSIAAQIGCGPTTLRTRVWRTERDAGQRVGLTTDERERLKQLEREKRELCQANAILKKA